MLHMQHMDHLIPIDSESSAGSNRSGSGQTQSIDCRDRLFSHKFCSILLTFLEIFSRLLGLRDANMGSHKAHVDSAARAISPIVSLQQPLHVTGEA
jgi:hypothetical protein